MTWNYVAGDNYDLEQLREFELFFLRDYRSAVIEVDKHELLRKWGLPNWRLGMIRRQVGVDEAVANLRTVGKVISVLKRESK